MDTHSSVCWCWIKVYTYIRCILCHTHSPSFGSLDSSTLFKGFAIQVLQMFAANSGPSVLVLLNSSASTFIVNSLKELQILCNKIILWPVKWKMTHVIKDSFRFISFLLSKFSKILVLLFRVCTRFSMIFHKSANEMGHRLTYNFLLSNKLYLVLRFLAASIKLTVIEKNT